MSSSLILIFSEVFLVLVGISAFLFYYLNNINNDLLSKIDRLSKSLKDEKKHTKGLRVKIQEQLSIINDLEGKLQAVSDLSDDEESLVDDELSNNKDEILAKQQALEKKQKKIESLNQQLNKLQKQLGQSQSKIEQLKAELLNAPGSLDKDYEQLYYELRNAVAYNMTGGDLVLERLSEHLDETGNSSESDKLAELKERYNSLGEMVGVVGEVELFSDAEKIQKKQETEVIRNTQSLVQNVSETLQEAQELEDQWSRHEKSAEKELSELRMELNETSHMNRKLRTDLDKANEQLLRFVAKARLFQAQKEQMQASKATQSQMHRNFINLRADYKSISRKYKTLKARNEILNAQVANSTENIESVKKLQALRANLEAKESEMDRLELEKDMLEQQFLMIAKESDESLLANKELERLKSEHILLEEQFLEVLKQLEKNENSSNE
ncbi:hypothetical protein [Aliikangiella sp. IMCC44359]|uniref:hypothetical protein n=1 Tax=Aliikangiella sp. IMCC44359 TaxID=3459125 RepID=UPI00403B1E8D